MKKFFMDMLFGLIYIIMFIFVYRHMSPEYALAIGFALIMV